MFAFFSRSFLCSLFGSSTVELSAIQLSRVPKIDSSLERKIGSTGWSLDASAWLDCYTRCSIFEKGSEIKSFWNSSCRKRSGNDRETTEKGGVKTRDVRNGLEGRQWCRNNSTKWISNNLTFWLDEVIQKRCHRVWIYVLRRSIHVVRGDLLKRVIAEFDAVGTMTNRRLEVSLISFFFFFRFMALSGLSGISYFLLAPCNISRWYDGHHLGHFVFIGRLLLLSDLPSGSFGCSRYLRSSATSSGESIQDWASFLSLSLLLWLRLSSSQPGAAIETGQSITASTGKSVTLDRPTEQSILSSQFWPVPTTTLDCFVRLSRS